MTEPTTVNTEEDPSPREHPAHEARHGHPGKPCRDRSICYPGDRSSDPS